MSSSEQDGAPLRPWSLRFTGAELQQYSAHARARGLSLASMMRRALQRFVHDPGTLAVDDAGCAGVIVHRPGNSVPGRVESIDWDRESGRFVLHIEVD